MALARQRRDAGATVVTWTAEVAAALRGASLEAASPRELLSTQDFEQIDEAAIAWTRAFGKRRLYDGQSLRELFEWKGVSLWWFAELYLFHSTGAAGRVRLIETFRRILAASEPDEVEVVGLSAEETLLLGRTCLNLGILFHGPRRVPRLRLALTEQSRRLRVRWTGVKTVATAAKALLLGAPAAPAAGRKSVVFVSHAAFWKQRTLPDGRVQEYEHYFDRLIPGVAEDAELQPHVVAVGPRTSFRRRGAGARVAEWFSLGSGPRPYTHMNRYTNGRVLRAFRQASREARDVWSRLRGSPGAHEAFSFAGVSFADLSAADLLGTLCLQLPWAVRCYEEVSQMLESVEPALVCLYAEDSGWGRAAEAACRAAAVPTLGIQHGIIYPRYFSYQHGADEADCPRPDVTAVFGESARRFLIEEGHYDPSSLVVTGSPKFDVLLESSKSRDREALRRQLGIEPEEQALVVASRYRPLRRNFRSIGSALAGLIRAVEELEGVRLLIKPHPAEPSEPYLAEARRQQASRTRVLPASTDLLELLFATDALITVESLAAVEALVLDRPVLILNMPTNLREMVDRGAALGVSAGQDPGPQLRRLLFDESARARLDTARGAYVSDVAFGRDGDATERILALIRQTARRERVLG